MSLWSKKMAHERDETMFEMRDGEERLKIDPALMPADDHVVFIGRIASPWTAREVCPKNMRAARDTGQVATLHIDAAYRDGLRGLEGASHVVILTWLHHAPRNLIVQKPRHAAEAKGVFALRSPARPNPIGLHVARLIALDAASGHLDLDAIDVLDGTPVIDIKPYFPSIDAIPEATIANRSER
jgi:tRNA-Thr(GGU) m(6)t(6)A37 methyltransferase TsaA